MVSRNRVGVIFDLDRTLVDLPVDIDEVRRTLRETFSPLGYERGFRPILRCIEEAAVIAGKARQAELRARAFGILDDAEVRAAKSAVLVPGATQVLDALRARKIPFAIVTNNSRACLPIVFAHLGVSCPAVTRDDMVQPKPDPDGVLQAIHTLHAEHVVFVGDAVTDVQAGVAARADWQASLTTVRLYRSERGEGDVPRPDFGITSLVELLTLPVIAGAP